MFGSTNKTAGPAAARPSPHVVRRPQLHDRPVKIRILAAVPQMRMRHGDAQPIRRGDAGGQLILFLAATVFRSASSTVATSVSDCFRLVPLEICAVTSSTACVCVTLVCSQATPGEPGRRRKIFRRRLQSDAPGDTIRHRWKSRHSAARVRFHLLLTRTASRFVPLATSCS